MNANIAVLGDYPVIKDPKNNYKLIDMSTKDYDLLVEKGDCKVVCSGSYEDCTSYKTNGQLFKIRHGVSKSTKRNMKKQGLLISNPGDLEAYRESYKKRRAEIAKAKREKRHKALAGKKVKASTVKKK